MGQNNEKLILGGILIKLILIIRNDIYPNLFYLRRHFSNYLITNGKYLIYHFLFTKG